MAPKRATGANTFVRGRIETDYGVPPGGDFAALPVYSWGASAVQELLDEPLLGYGRDPLPPQRGAIDVTGQAVVPVDHRMFGFWLRLQLGDEVGAPVQIGARGYIEFAAQPAPGSTIVLDGIPWTFVEEDGAAGETEIGATLADTLAALADNLNASADDDISAATYSVDGNRLAIQHDTASALGNGFSLAASAGSRGRVSGPTLLGGGFYRHVWHSAAPSLPSATVETEHRDLEPGSERFYAQHGLKANGLQIQRQRAGAIRAQIDLIGQTETKSAASIGGTPQTAPIDIFSQFHGSIRVSGGPAANLTGATLALGNNLDVVQSLRDDGAIEGADPGMSMLGFTLVARYSNSPLKAAADGGVPVTIDFGFRSPGSGAELLFRAHEIHLPQPRREVTGPGGIEVTYEARGAQAISLGRALTVTLINDRSAAY